LFDYRDVNKNIYGDNKSDLKCWKAKINVGADGDIFQLVENSRYDGSKQESGKNIKSHKGVNHWDYYIKTVQIDNSVFDLVANIRKKSDGAFVYSLQLNENKKIKASPSLGLPKGSLNRMHNASSNSISADSDNVNTKLHLKQSVEETQDRFSLSNKAEDIAPVGDFSTPLNELYYNQDIGPVRESIPETETFAPAVEDSGPVKSAPVLDDIGPVAEQNIPETLTRSKLHSNIVDNIKSEFSGKGFDFDEVLKKAKNLSTFKTVDNTPQRVIQIVYYK